MTAEQARIHMTPKSWGRTDLRPWNGYHDRMTAIGEASFERADPAARRPDLSLTLLFTREPPPTQANAAAGFARPISLAHSSCAAWYVLSATADARIAVGSTQTLSSSQLRTSVRDGSFANRVQWQPARTGDSTFMPPGTIHAIGSGLAVVEIQRKSRATARQLDPPPDGAIPAETGRRLRRPTFPHKLTAERTVLVANPAFILERMTLAAGVARELDVCVETWLFVLMGSGRVDSLEVTVGNAVLLAADRASVLVGTRGLQCLVAYARSVPASYLLRRINSMRVPDPQPSPPRTVVRLPSDSTLRSSPGAARP